MSVYPPPTRTTAIFNPVDFIGASSASEYVTQSYVDDNYLKKSGGQSVLALETFQGGIATNEIEPYTGTDINFAGNITQDSGKTTSLNTTTVNGTVTCSRLICSGNIQSFTTLPTFATTNIGYSAIFPLTTTTTVAAGYNKLNTTGATIPTGVWLVNAVAALSATTSNYTLTGFYIGVSDSATALATYSTAVGGLRYDKYSSSHTVVFNDVRFQPIFEYSQTITLSASTTLYGFFYLNAGSGGTLQLSTNSYLQVTRIA
ncbi:MAG: hypothetical protein EBU96_05485 [Actinobacteria bacterium]|nr:hypothetical protein [Actinomycetota bacterium]